MMYTRLSTLKRLTLAQIAIGNAINDPVLCKKLEEEGYDKKRLHVGLSKVERAQQLHSSQHVEYATRLSATGELKQVHKAMRKAFVHDRNVARMALEPMPGLNERLGLKGRVSNKREFFLHQMRHFYRQIQASEDVREAIERYTLTPQVITVRIEQVEAFAAAMKKQQVQSGEAQVATRRRREAMADLDNWMVQFLFVAKRVFKNEPKQLDKLWGRQNKS